MAMEKFPTLLRKLWRYGYGALGSTYYQGTNGDETELPIGTEGQVETVVAGVPAWADPQVRRSDISALAGLVAFKASLWSPTFIGTPRVPTASPSTNSTQAASTAYVDAAVAAGGGAGSVDPSAVSAALGLVESKAPLLSPNFLGTPKKNGVALATTADITASSPDSDQNILATQIFGA